MTFGSFQRLVDTALLGTGNNTPVVAPNCENIEMIVTYGVARDHDDPPNHVIGDGERNALLGGDSTLKGVGKAEGHASIVSSVSNLSNTIVGSGMLTFPLAMASVGVIPGILTCIFSGSVAAFGLYLLSLAAPKAPHRRASFFTISELTFPRAAVFFDLAIAIKCFGVSISYLIIIKSLMPNVVASLYHDLTSPTTNPPAWMLSGRVWLVLFMAILIPLAFLRQLNSLRHTSYVALFAVAYLVTIVITGYFYPFKGMSERGEVHLIHFRGDFVSTFPVQVFAFTCAQNLFPIYNELVSNTQKRLNLVIMSSIGAATLTYEIIAVFGYLTFGSNVSANIIAMYPSTSLFIAIGQLAIVILVLFSYPLQVHPCRNCLDKVFHAGGPHLTVKRPDTMDDEEGDEEDEEDEVDDEFHTPPDMTPSKHTALTTAIITSSFLIAYFVNDLKLVLSFVGSTGSTTISFILPGLLYWQLFRHDPNASKTLTRAAFGLFLYGTFIFVFCLTYNIFGLINTSGKES